ncbi:MAG: hypothetical protein ACP5NX_04455 [Candidatus Bilamarchaeaceae archaeon]
MRLINWLLVADLTIIASLGIILLSMMACEELGKIMTPDPSICTGIVMRLPPYPYVDLLIAAFLSAIVIAWVAEGCEPIP